MTEKWHDIFQIQKEKNFQLQILYLTEWSFKNKEERKTCSDEEKLRKFIANKLTFKEWLKKIFVNRKEKTEGNLEFQKAK